MAVSYKLVQNTNSKSTYKGQFYAKAVMTDETNLETLSERIQRNCSMKKSDVKAVLTELVEVLIDELQASHKVTIDGFGSFKMGIKGSYAATEEAFNAAKNISGYRVNFRPEANRIKTGTTTDADGNTVVKYAYTNNFTTGIAVQQY